MALNFAKGTLVILILALPLLLGLDGPRGSVDLTSLNMLGVERLLPACFLMILKLFLLYVPFRDQWRTTVHSVSLILL